MAYDEFLAERIHKVIGRKRGITEKKMFGGLAFLLHGNMACGIVGEKLMLRLDKESAATAQEQPHVVPMDFTGRPMKTMAFVEPAGIEADQDLHRRVEETLEFAKSLPPKDSQ